MNIDAPPNSDPSELPDPSQVRTREELGSALTVLRSRAGLSVRDVVRKVPGLAHGTASGWFSGQHVPTRASISTFLAMLEELGVCDNHEQWRDAVDRVRARPGPKAAKRRRAGLRTAVQVTSNAVHHVDDEPSSSSVAAHTPRVGAEPPVDGSPYVGLRPYTANDAGLFHGRKDAVAAVLLRLEANRQTPLMVIGASGSGKSSLVMAGVTPELSKRGRCVTVLRPTEVSPETVSGADCNPTVVIVVDQLEELWGDDISPEQRREIVRLLSERAQAGCAVVCTLRADFFQQALAIAELREALDNDPLVLGPPDREALTEIIVQPARDMGYTVEPALVTLLLDAVSPVGSEPGDRSILPLLSHVLLLCWELCRRRRITVDDYYSTGGIEGAIRVSAEAVYSQLDATGRNASRALFLRVVDLPSGQLIRRRAPLSSLSAEEAQVVSQYTAVGLLSVDDDTVTPTHEVVLFSWPRLTGWIDADRDWLRLLTRIRLGAADWDDSGRADAALPSASATADFQRWRQEQQSESPEAHLGPVEQHYLDAAVAYHQNIADQDRRRLRTVSALAAGLAVVTILALVATVLAVQATDEARTTRDIAFSRSGAQYSTSTFDQDPSLGRAIALAAYRVHPTLEARSALLNTTKSDTPLRFPTTVGAGRAIPVADPGCFVVGSTDGTLRFFKADGQEHWSELRLSEGERTELYDLTVAESGAVMATAGQSGVHLVDVTDLGQPKVITTVGADLGPLHSVSISPDEKTIAAGGLGGKVYRWPLSAQGDIVEIVQDEPRIATTESAGESDRVEALAWLDDSRTLLVSDGTTGVKSFTEAHATGTARPGPLLDNGGVRFPLAITLSPDGRTIAAGTTGRDIWRWSFDGKNLERAQKLPTLTGWSSFVNDVDIDEKGRVVGAGSDESIRIFDKDGTLLAKLPGSQVTTSAQFFDGSDVGEHLLTYSLDGVARVWELNRMPGTTETNAIFQSASSADRSVAVLGVTASEKHYTVVDTTGPAPRPISTIVPNEETRFTGSVSMAPDGDYVYAATAEGGLQIYQAPYGANNRSIGSVTATNGIIVTNPVSPDGRTVAMCSNTVPKVALVDVSNPSSPTVRAVMDLDDPCLVAEFSADSTQLAVTTSGPNTMVFDTSDPDDPIALPSIDSKVGTSATVGYAHNSNIVAISGGDEIIRLYDMADPANPHELSDFAAPKGEVYWLAFSSDDSQLIATSSTGQVTVFDVTDPATPDTWAILGATSDPLLYQGRVASPSGGVLAVGIEGAVTMWQLDIDRTIEEACSGGVRLTDEEWHYYLPDVEPRPLCD